MSFAEYIQGLPLNKVVQIHLCSPAFDEAGNIYDAHQPPQEEQLKVVAEVIKKYNPQYLTLEYYKDVQEVATLLKTLRERFCA